ncbi:predicted protein, partial [Nematostella vectensis]
MPTRSHEFPNLYFSQSDVTVLRAQSGSTHAAIYSSLRDAAEEMKQRPHATILPRSWREFTGKWNEIYGNNLPPLAFYCVLNSTDRAALELAISTMEAFAGYQSWGVSHVPKDDVPVAHSIVGMATAYDFLYKFLNESQRVLIGAKIIEFATVLYERSLKAWWGNSYVQNHVATNYAALLTSALVVQSLTPNAKVWINRANMMLNRTMTILGRVTDGSLSEGVAYGSYTTRSLFQYLFLAMRHLGLQEDLLRKNRWLVKHFDFIYWTILPRFDETIGIADTNTHWFYGPEDQLVFLERFVMRDGRANWLARAIREQHRKGTIRPARAHRFVTLHLEYLFYDSSIPDKPPINPDWATTGLGKTPTDRDKHAGAYTERQSDKPMGTYLSYKCGVLHGKAINQIVRDKTVSWINGWRNFNPGHEHPDQGSFIFYPSGRPFITEALYGPKYTWLNNALMFAPAPPLVRTCRGPYAGQLGDCGKWFAYQASGYWEGRTGNLAAAVDGRTNRMFATGEYAARYDPELVLDKISRSLLLIRPDTLIVLDNIRLAEYSNVRAMSAFFHNRYNAFVLNAAERWAEVLVEGKPHRVHWACPGNSGCILDAQVQAESYKAEYGKRSTHYLNITSTVGSMSASIVYVFTGPSANVSA